MSLFTFLVAAAGRYRTQRRRLRTVWGYTPILTLPLLAQCDRMLGLRSQSFVFITYYVSKAFDINLRLVDKVALSRHVLSRFPNAYARARRLIFCWALLRYDVFHLFYDRGILASPYRIGISPEELQLLKQNGKRLYVYAYGADVRVRELTLQLGRYNLCAECPDPGKHCICRPEEALINIQNIRESATAMIAMGDMKAYVPGCLDVHYWPIDCGRMSSAASSVASASVRGPGAPLRIAHAPNNAHFKGTHYLETAVRRLQDEGYKVELIRVQGVPNEKVIELFSTADIVADQFIAGFYGYTALEAMSLGKPVLCYIRDRDMVVAPEHCPIINVDPATLYSTLKSCAEGQIDLRSIGALSRWYVQRYHSLEAVAARLGRLYLETAQFPRTVENRVRQTVIGIEAGLAKLDSVRPASIQATGFSPAEESACLT